MFFPWTALALLAFESTSVINLRLAKIGLGGSQAIDEVRLMFDEKTDAAVEASTNLILGGTLAGLVARYRFHVAENLVRLQAVAHVA